MNKQELVASVVEKANNQLTKKQAEAAVNAVFESIKGALSSKDKVSLVGFGTFEVRERGARKAKNPRTGEEIEIAAGSVPAFRPGKELKDVVSAGGGN